MCLLLLLVDFFFVRLSQLEEMENQRTTEKNNNLVFAVNGERFELPTVDPSTTLLEFLRTQTRFKSVKLSCGEGTLFLYICVCVCVYLDFSTCLA